MHYCCLAHRACFCFHPQPAKQETVSASAMEGMLVMLHQKMEDKAEASAARNRGEAAAGQAHAESAGQVNLGVRFRKDVIPIRTRCDRDSNLTGAYWEVNRIES